MGVDSYLEIFTTMLGWAFSGIVMQVVFDTGLYLVPILFVLAKIVIQGYEEGFEGPGLQQTIRRLQVQIYTTIFVLMTCVQTTSVTTLTRLQLSYSPPATVVNPNPRTVNGGDTGTTYDSLPMPTQTDLAAVPVWWYTVMGISSGVSSAVRARISSSTTDFRSIENLAQIATVEDPQLRAEIQRFASECYIPARSRFLRTEPRSEQAVQAIDVFGPGDLDWIGSHALRDDPAMYAAYFSSRPVTGFPFNAAVETDLNQGEEPPQWGRPSCREWWADPDVGLRRKMVDSVGALTRGASAAQPGVPGVFAVPRLIDQVRAAFNGVSEENQLDLLARLATTKAAPTYTRGDFVVGSDRPWYSEAAHAVTDVLGAAGTAYEGFKSTASMAPLMALLQMAQPLILMGLYIFLPLLTVLSGYSLKVFVNGAVAIFSVKFWWVMWTVARWLDDNLIAAMNPNDYLRLGSMLDSLDAGHKRVTLNILLLVMFVALPLIWTALLAWIGVQMGAGMTMLLSEAKKIGENAGKTGAEIPGKVYSEFKKKKAGP